MKNRETKTHNISFRCNEADYIYIKNHAQKRNTTISKYLLESRIPSHCRKKISKRYISDIVLLTQTVNDITEKIQSTDNNEELLKLIQILNMEVKKIWEI